MNRRFFLKSALAVFAAQAGLALPWLRAAAQPSSWRHGFSQFGDLKYGKGFQYFDYVNASAPKSGQAKQIALGTFDNFNIVLAEVKGVPVQGIELLYDQLLVASLDEPSSYYGLLAEELSYPEDMSWVSFRLRREAKWHDGRPITPADVLFSYTTFKELNPQSAADFDEVKTIEQTGDREVRFHLQATGNRGLPAKLGSLVVLPKHWWQAANESGAERKVSETTLEPPLGSGPYRVKRFEAGREIVYERVQDYWGRSLNVNIGRNNFDELKFEYFRDATVAIEAFKKGTVDWRVENSAKSWATNYDFPAVTEKRVVLEEFPIQNFGIMQAFAFNLRRNKFADIRVRRAFNYVLNFEELNRQLFYGQYKRISSYFENTELAATGLPSARELALLQPLREQIPKEVFSASYANPTNENAAAVRTNTREALRLLIDAGYEIREQQLVDRKSGEAFSVELLSNSPLFERVYLFYKPALERLGMAVTVRTVDPSQYENRLRNWEFDLVTFAWGESLVPGNEQRGYWGSHAADQPGSYNVVGIKNPAVDVLVEQVISARTRDDLLTACHALDRVLLWNHYVVPQWSYPKLRTARWDRFGYQSPLPKYGMSGFPTLWWWEAEKAAKISG